MQHVRIAFYQLKPKHTADEMVSRVQAEFLPIFRNEPGFIGYGLVKTSETSVVSLSFWQSHEEAEAAVQFAASWVKDTISEMIASLQNYVGDLSFFSSTGTIGS
jgi:heme-degrading monooxygenase HmoA